MKTKSRFPTIIAACVWLTISGRLLSNALAESFSREIALLKQSIRGAIPSEIDDVPQAEGDITLHEQFSNSTAGFFCSTVAATEGGLSGIRRIDSRAGGRIGRPRRFDA